MFAISFLFVFGFVKLFAFEKYLQASLQALSLLCADVQSSQF
jgi:hypothetical protein